jgi:hypothetical protein
MTLNEQREMFGKVESISVRFGPRTYQVGVRSLTKKRLSAISTRLMMPLSQLITTIIYLQLFSMDEVQNKDIPKKMLADYGYTLYKDSDWIIRSFLEINDHLDKLENLPENELLIKFPLG